jgi:hypothetical protein
VDEASRFALFLQNKANFISVLLGVLSVRSPRDCGKNAKQSQIGSGNHEKTKRTQLCCFHSKIEDRQSSMPKTNPKSTQKQRNLLPINDLQLIWPISPVLQANFFQRYRLARRWSLWYKGETTGP